MKLWKRNKKERDPALDEATAQVVQSLTTARKRRDTEQRRLQEERGEVVQPLRQIHASNHLADLALQALRRNS
jgi:hypothetical protein